MASRDEKEALAGFRETYGLERADVAGEIETRVIGGDWGVNGYTTVGQVRDLITHLQITSSDRVLDFGTGRGWPAVYLAMKTGCQVVGSDMPLESLRDARRRAALKDVADRVSVVSAMSADQPFRRGAFDVVVHTDTLC